MSERRWSPSGGRCAGSLRKFFSFVASFQSHSPKEIDQLSPPPTSLLPPKRALRVHGLRFLIRLEAFLLKKEKRGRPPSNSLQPAKDCFISPRRRSFDLQTLEFQKIRLLQAGYTTTPHGRDRLCRHMHRRSPPPCSGCVCVVSCLSIVTFVYKYFLLIPFWGYLFTPF